MVSALNELVGSMLQVPWAKMTTISGDTVAAGNGLDRGFPPVWEDLTV
jgi:hypothetical protein